MDVWTGIKVGLGMEQVVEQFASVIKYPIDVGQAGEDDAPFVSFPPEDKKRDCGYENERMITDPNRAVKIGFRRVIGEVGEFVQKAVGQKGDDGSQAQGEFGMPGAFE